MVDKEVPVAQEKPEIEAEDAEAIAVSDGALRDFTIELNRLHIAFGAPSYAAIVKASVKPKLTKAGINEALSGKRLPTFDSLMEFVRVVSSPLPAPVDAPAPRCRPALAEAWKARWEEAKFAQRRAQAPWRRLRNTVRETLDEAYREAQTVRAAAHKEADRLLADARHTADVVWKTKPNGTAKNTDAVAEGSVAASAISPDLRVALLKGTPFWLAVPKTTDLLPEDGGATPIAVLAPGTWYLGIEGNEAASELVVQTKDGRRGLIRDLARIQIG
ncbi:hypothetical protein [Streptomyces sp. NBC_00893]|uniref:hypothetical protein n=1 Tax=Streptomyces sp. NBC_00893 TaxID=2975862 RepID=UPI0022548818|nr:hypothetical protein [Streptomyces sp. NBC_00893]MCX4851694.1 hypothetical protein [Streptomyces sp. NBC_00893]